MKVPKTDDLNYAMAYAYDNNSNMYECLKFVRENYPAFNVYDDEYLERIWDAIDAYVDIAVPGCTTQQPSVPEDVRRDAERYRFLRDEDNWGEDTEPYSWEALGEAHADAFDAIVDARMIAAAKEEK